MGFTRNDPVLRNLRATFAAYRIIKSLYLAGYADASASVTSEITSKALLAFHVRYSNLVFDLLAEDPTLLDYLVALNNRNYLYPAYVDGYLDRVKVKRCFLYRPVVAWKQRRYVQTYRYKTQMIEELIRVSEERGK